jgi:ABC-type multidrug transport system ATPase subunit
MHCQLKGISKRFGRDWVLKDVQLEIEGGAHIALIGNNGSGKSTLMRIISGQLGPSKGEVIYTVQERLVPVEKVFEHLSFVAPYIDIYRQFTFRELVDFHFSLRSIRKGTTRADVLDSLSVPQDKVLSSFSSGMIQRVKLALAFNTHSNLMLFDEPTMNLDEEGSDWFKARLREIPDEVTIIVASNDPERETSTFRSFYRIHESSLLPIPIEKINKA